MSKRRNTKGMKDTGGGAQALFVDTRFDLKLTAEMLADMPGAVPAAGRKRDGLCNHNR